MKLVIFVISESVFSCEKKILRNFPLDIHLLKDKSSLVCQYIFILFSISEKCLISTNGDGGMHTHCSTFYPIINVLLVINMVDFIVKNILW